MGLLSNGTGIVDRRDKHIQQELKRKSGLRAVRQVLTSSFSEVESLLETEESIISGNSQTKPGWRLG
jgi:hypothetical protein